MDLAAFERSLDEATPPADLDPPLAALWWDAKQDWNRAHDLVAQDVSAAAAWVHAYLHRKEGDNANAGYWYRRAGRVQPACLSTRNGEISP